MRIFILSIFVGTMLGIRLVHAGELTSAFTDEDSAQEFSGYYYKVYHFEPDHSTQGYIAVLSTAFDAYLLLIDPERRVSSNDDHGVINLTDARSSDAALPVSGQATGQWTAIATTFGAGATGDFTIRYNGTTALREIDRSEMDEQLLERSFAKRDVFSEASPATPGSGNPSA